MNKYINYKISHSMEDKLNGKTKFVACLYYDVGLAFRWFWKDKEKYSGRLSMRNGNANCDTTKRVGDKKTFERVIMAVI